ncbi:MAG: ExbD/TolR family protein [Pirellulaceae bacterium]
MTHESLQFVCPACGKSYAVTPQAQGHRMRCPICDVLVDVNPASTAKGTDFRQTRELTPAEVRGFVNSGIMEPGRGEDVEGPPLAMQEPEAPPLMRAPLARPAGPPPRPPTNGTLLDAKDKPPDARLPKRAKRVPMESEMDMTPMVDCVFQLLIFFMLTASFAVQKSLLVPKPTVDEAAALPEPKDENLEAVTVRIDSQGHFFISGGGLTDEFEASARVELIMRLKQARDVSSGTIPNKLMVLAHGDALHERVVEAVDAGNDVGMEEVGLKMVEDDEQ